MTTQPILDSSYLPLNTTVPILVDNASANNNQGFGLTGSSAAGGNVFFNCFSTGGSAYWQPNTAGAEFIQVNYPYPCVNKGFLYQCRGATSSNYYSGCSVSASNDGVNFYTLVTIPDIQMQNININSIQFPNSQAYKFYRFSITSTIGTITNLGFFNQQYSGYVLF